MKHAVASHIDAPQSAANCAPSPLELLALDPDVSSQRLLLAMLRGSGASPFRTACLRDGAALGATLAKQPIDAIFVSLLISDDALGACARTARAHCEGLPIIGYGSINFASDKQRIQNLGLTGMIPPASLTALGKVIGWLRDPGEEPGAFPYDVTKFDCAKAFREAERPRN